MKNKDRILPEDVQCPLDKEDCDGCGRCDLIQFYEDNKNKQKLVSTKKNIR